MYVHFRIDILRVSLSHFGDKKYDSGIFFVFIFVTKTMLCVKTILNKMKNIFRTKLSGVLIRKISQTGHNTESIQQFIL